MIVPPAREVPPIAPGQNPSPPPAAPNDWLKMVKIAMLVVTGLWLMGMPACGVLSYAGEMAKYRKAGERTYVDRALREGFVDDTDVEMRASVAFLTGGFCAPTFFYGVAMTVLIVGYFVARP